MAKGGWVSKEHAQDNDGRMTPRQRMAAYDATRLKTLDKQHAGLKKLLKARPPKLPDEHALVSQRMTSYEKHRKVAQKLRLAEMRKTSEASVFKVVSLGSSCAVNTTLLKMGLRQEAYPFDNIRTSIEGVIHFVDTQFENFVPHRDNADSDCIQRGGRQSRATYSGDFHSFWHDNLDASEEIAKYKRRIDRFLALRTAEFDKLFFVFACNSSLEVASGERLLCSLHRLFGEGRVWLLLLVDYQAVSRLLEVEGTDGRLLVHCMVWHECEDQGTQFQEGIREGISSFIKHVETSSKIELVQNCALLESRIYAYTGGDPRREKYKLRKVVQRPVSTPPCRSKTPTCVGRHRRFGLPSGRIAW